MRPLALKLILDDIDRFVATETPKAGDAARLADLMARARIELAGLTPAARLEPAHKVLDDALQLLAQARYRLAHVRLPETVTDAAWLPLLSRIQAIEADIAQLVERNSEIEP